MRPRRLGAIAAATLLAGLVATPSQSAEASTRRVVENLDRGLVAVPSGQGTFLSWRLLGTEYARYGNAIAFNVYKGGRRLSREPVTKSTTYQDNSPGTDHTALRLYTTTEPTKTRIYTLAQNPEYRLGRTVRGYLQSTYTDYYLGTGTRRVPKPAITPTSTEGDASHDDHS
ncbi:hypothetical protein [Streptomyces sp. NBC_01615]|uniref:rhamnogalacturonan endolyase family protein n=1 Tax=Streptomyces sp. NBC_01615 TaxID=2975898 RepID=UPI00386E6E20